MAITTPRKKKIAAEWNCCSKTRGSTLNALSWLLTADIVPTFHQEIHSVHTGPMGAKLPTCTAACPTAMHSTKKHVFGTALKRYYELILTP